jgi:hypothetical protein
MTFPKISGMTFPKISGMTFPKISGMTFPKISGMTLMTFLNLSAGLAADSRLKPLLHEFTEYHVQTGLLDFATMPRAWEKQS